LRTFPRTDVDTENVVLGEADVKDGLWRYHQMGESRRVEDEQDGSAQVILERVEEDAIDRVAELGRALADAGPARRPLDNRLSRWLFLR